MSEETVLSLPALSARRGMACALQMFGAWMVEPKWFASAARAVQSGVLKPEARGARGAGRRKAGGGMDSDDTLDSGDDSGDDPIGSMDTVDIDASGSPRMYSVVDGVATIRMDGQMQKGESSFGGCSTVKTRRAIRQAASDWMVKAISLRICSPGGTVAGTSELAADVAAANAIKPVYAYIEDLGCSAAYWVASQARSITCNDTAMVGSIGTMVMLADTTGAQEQFGIKYTVVSTGDFKGLGADGKVSDLLVSDVQREINDMNTVFLAAVTAGRGAVLGGEKGVKAIADGRVHVGAQAKQLGLVDAVSSYDAYSQAILQEIGTMPITAQQFAQHAAENPQAVEVQALIQKGIDQAKSEANRPATLEEIEAIAPNDSAFALSQLKAKATVAQANAAATAELRKQLAAKDAQIAEANKKAADAEAKAKIVTANGGQPPIPTDGSTTAEGEVSEARKAQLLNATPLGQSALEARQAQQAVRSGSRAWSIPGVEGR